MPSQPDIADALAGVRFLIGIDVGPQVGAGSAIPWPGGFDPVGWAIAHGEWGKPYFANRPDVCFNISHAAGAIVVGLCRRPIGLDVERIGRYDHRVAARVFSAAERAYVEADDSLVERRFCEVWTRKEARAKWSGEGGRGMINGPEVLNDPRFVTVSLGGHVLSLYC